MWEYEVSSFARRPPAELTETRYDDIQRCMIQGLNTEGDYSLISQFQPADLFLFTANSAIPVADTIRGIYDVLDLPTPMLDHIRTDHYIDKRKQESERLRKLYEGVGRVAIVEQYIVTGKTVRRAKEVANAANLSATYVIKGRWYHHAHLTPKDVLDTTSEHATFMRNVGHIAGASISQ